MSDLHRERMRIPRRYWSPTPLTGPCAEFHANLKKNCFEGKGLYLVGNPDHRTHVACTLLMGLIGTTLRGVFVFANDAKSCMLGNAIFSGNQTYLDRMLEVDLLVLESFGGRDDNTNMLCDILRRRYLDVRSTIVTSDVRKIKWKDTEHWQGIAPLDEFSIV